jgi:hexosaminidase
MSAFRLPLAAMVLTLSLAGSASPASDPADAYPDLHLIPWPKSLQLNVGQLRITAESRIVASTDSLRPLAEVLADEIAKLTGIRLKVTQEPGRPGDILLKINAALKAGEQILMLRNREPVRTTDGAHTITINDMAVVEGFDYRATAEGTATILQLLGKSEGVLTLPKVTIKDWPHADYCGVMLDVARQDHPIEAIQKVVQLCRLYKARYLQLHLTDDQGWTFPSTRFPKLGTKNYGAHGGIAPHVYKLDELKALVAYADARGVTLVPELEVPGHSGAATRAMPEIFDAINPQSKQPVGIGCMNMSNEEIYPALDTIIGEMCDVFRSSPYFHIGSDEVTSGRLSLHPGYPAFMAKHNLKDDHQLADHFVASMCALVKKHGKKAIKWEGLSNTATKDVIIMGWELNSTVASDMLARGYTTITVPWTLAVPWEQWNMYVCNGSRLKKGDSVLGAALVAWEQPPLTHITNLRSLASRQERTWGPDNPVTVGGFAARFQPLDILAGKLIDLPPKPQYDATVSTSLGTRDFLQPVFAFDGNDATFFQSATAPKAGEHFTLTFPKPKQVYAIEVLTGSNRRGQLSGGEVQVSRDGTTFTTVGTLDKGVAQTVLKDNAIRAIRLRATADQSEPLIVRAVNLRLLVDLSGTIRNPGAVVGEGNVGVTKGNTEFAYPIGTCNFPVINQDFTLKLNNGGNPFSFAGPISGSGKVEIHAGGANAPLVLDGKLANTMTGTWSIQAGQVVLAKEPGVDAMGGTVVVGGTSDQDVLVWNASDQLNDAAQMHLHSGASLKLNGFGDIIASLSLAAGAKVMTDGSQGRGVLKVRELTVDGKCLPRGVYMAPSGWLQGGGYVTVGDVKVIAVADLVNDPNKTIGADNIARLKSTTRFKIPEGGCAGVVDTAGGPLVLESAGRNANFSGFITGGGSLQIKSSAGQPLTIAGTSSNSFTGTTTLEHGVLRLGKTVNAIAIPGNLLLGGSAVENKGDTVIWDADGQFARTSVVTVQGTQAALLDLKGHKSALSKLLLSKAAKVQTGTGGELYLKQLFVDGTRLKDGVYQAPQPWLAGTGTVTVDARVDVKGVIGAPELAIGPGNIGNLIGDTKIGYPSSGGDIDIATNGFTLKLDSGDGNAFAYLGCISGKGSVEFYMGPSSTGYQDAPLRLTGLKANTTSGKFLVKKGRVQLEKREGVDAISGDVIVGGQGFNDCLFWQNSHQLKDTVNIALLDAGNSGAAYLHLNGCQETAASLSMTANNKVRTDSTTGVGGELTVKALSVAGVAKPAGTYTAATVSWIEGTGKVIVRP